MKELSDSHVRQHLLTSWWLISFPTYFSKQLWETTRIRVQAISCHCKAPSPILVREQFNQCYLDWMESERWARRGLCNQMSVNFNFNVLNFSNEMHWDTKGTILYWEENFHTVIQCTECNACELQSYCRVRILPYMSHTSSQVVHVHNKGCCRGLH